MQACLHEVCSYPEDFLVSRIELNMDYSEDYQLFSATTRVRSTQSYHQRYKHIDIRHHFLLEKRKAEFIKFESCGTNDMMAENITKALLKFCSFGLGLRFEKD